MKKFFRLSHTSIVRDSKRCMLPRYLSTDGKSITTDTSAYCIDLVKKHDYESYLIGLLFPKQHRAAYFAIKAFNVEVATIRDQIPRNAQQAGRIRFQFWRDVLNDIQKNKSIAKHNNQPVALELAKHVVNYNLTIRWFERCVEARYNDMLINGRYESYDDLENYAELAHSSLAYLLLELLGLKEDMELQYAASHIGVSTGLISLLRSYPYHASMGVCYFPHSLLQQFQMKENTAIRGPPTTPEEKKQFEDITHDMASQAYAHINTGKQQLMKSPHRSQGIYGLLTCINNELFLDTLQTQQFDIYQTCTLFNESSSPLSLQLKLLKATVMKSL